MKKICLSYLPLILCLFLTNSEAQQLNNKNVKVAVAIITAINIKGDVFIIQADFVQLLTGKYALAAARKTGEAEYNLNEKGDTAWYVSNDYYILNNTKRLRSLPVANAAQIYLIKAGTSTIGKSNLANLKNSFEGKLFRLSLFKNSIVKVVEIYTP